MHIEDHSIFDQTHFIRLTILLCLSLSLIACNKPNDASLKKVDAQVQRIELIQNDIIYVEQGRVTYKSIFSGTIRAVNQSNIQAQVTATVSAVQAQVGQTVAKGQTLVQLNNQDNAARLAQSYANLTSAQAQAQQAANMVQRKKRLYNQGFIAKVEYEQSQVDHQGQLENVKAQQATVDIAAKANQDGIIKSPISGVITKRQVEPGQTVTAGQTLFEIIDPNHLEIQAKLPAEQQSALKVGHKIEYTIQGNPQKLSAILSRISPIADPSSRQIDFFARPNEAINSLSIGAFVEGAIWGDSSIQGQRIPLDIIQNAGNKPYVWIIRNKKIQQVFVKILEQQSNENIAIVDGIQSNDLISRVKFSPDDINKTVVISAL